VPPAAAPPQPEAGGLSNLPKLDIIIQWAAVNAPEAVAKIEAHRSTVIACVRAASKMRILGQGGRRRGGRFRLRKLFVGFDGRGFGVGRRSCCAHEAALLHEREELGELGGLPFGVKEPRGPAAGIIALSKNVDKAFKEAILRGHTADAAVRKAVIEDHHNVAAHIGVDAEARSKSSGALAAAETPAS
jgi:hypothetical protein